MTSAEEGAVELDAASAMGPSEERSAVVVSCPFATPNGGLHLGHAAGPYLRADVYRRAATMRGASAVLITGIDDYQTYVDVMARRRSEDPLNCAIRNGDAILNTLERLGVDVQVVVRPASTARYREILSEGFARLAAHNAVERREVMTAYCVTCALSLYHGYVAGGCPSCGVAASGEICEACGCPNEALQLIAPRCVICGGPATARAEPALMLRLDRHREWLRVYHGQIVCSEHPSALVEQLLDQRLPDYRLTRAGHFGTPVPIDGFDGHVIDASVERMLSYLMPDVISALEGEHSVGPRVRPAYVQFLGYDGSFAYAILFPILARILGDERVCAAGLVSNEFLCLEGTKFSTSGNHAIWVDDVLLRLDPEVLRLAMLQHSPESCVRDLTHADRARIESGGYIAPIKEWLDGYAEIGRELGGVAPPAGAWTRSERRFVEHLIEALAEFAESLSLERFSSNGYAACLFALAEKAAGLRERRRHMLDRGASPDELAAVYAVELAAAKTFSIVAFPAMPKTARRLHEELGGEGEIRYERAELLLEAGTALTFSGVPYLESERLARQ
jgi:methionyl-tRNA synthetase